MTDLETGRGSLGIEDLILLPFLLEVDLADLFDTTEQLRVGGVIFSGQDIAKILTGRLTDLETLGMQLYKQEGPVAAGGEAEQHLARTLGRDVEDILRISFVLWGRPLTEERDRRLTEDRPGTLAQRRGHVTRQLRQDIEAALARQDLDRKISRQRHPSRRRKR